MKGQSVVRLWSCTSVRSASIRTPLPALCSHLLVALVHIAYAVRVMRLACVPLPYSRPSRSASRRPENERSMPPHRFPTLAMRGLHTTTLTFVGLCRHSPWSAVRGRPYQGRHVLFFRTEDAQRARQSARARAHGLGCAASAAPRH
ncbi:hypothetical protein FB451DRAFT_1222599 [Mycena latifolia]|nr:hypothetical protein FB451DRAFT_1222599 [Mycena latifolia]